MQKQLENQVNKLPIIGQNPSDLEFEVFHNNKISKKKLSFFEVNNNDIGRSASELIRKLEAAIFVNTHPGQVCPASWTPGKKTLKPGVDLIGKI